MLERHETIVAWVAECPQPAESLADRLGCSVRTIYRDVAILQRNGVPIVASTVDGIAIDRSTPIAVGLSLDELDTLLDRIAPDDAALLITRLPPTVAGLICWPRRGHRQSFPAP